MSSITIHSRKNDIASHRSGDVGRAHPASRGCRIGKCGIDFGWSNATTRKPFRQSSVRCQEEPGELDDRLRAHHLPECERFPTDRWALRGASPAHTPSSMRRQRRSAGRRRARRQPASGGNTVGDSCCRSQTGARRMSAGCGAGLRGSCAPLCAGRRWFATIREPVGGLQKEAEAVVLLQTSLARSAVLPCARCTQRALLQKTEEVSYMEEHVVCRFESSPSVLNVPATGKEGQDD